MTKHASFADAGQEIYLRRPIHYALPDEEPVTFAQVSAADSPSPGRTYGLLHADSSQAAWAVCLYQQTYTGKQEHRRYDGHCLLDRLALWRQRPCSLLEWLSAQQRRGVQLLCASFAGVRAAQEGGRACNWVHHQGGTSDISMWVYSL